MEMSKAATKKRIAKKNARVGGKKYVTPLPKAKKAAPKAKAGTMTDAKGRSRSLNPKTGIAPKRGALTKAQSAANETRRKNLRAESAGLQKTQKEQMAALDKAKLAGNMALMLTPGGVVVKGASLLGKAAPALRPLVSKGVSKLGKKVKSLFNKPTPKPKPKPTPKPTPSRPSGTPRRPSGSGSRTPQKPTGSGPRGGRGSATSSASKSARTTARAQRKTTRTQRRSQTQAERTAARKQRQAAKDRKERVGSGQSRVRRQRQNAGLAKGRNTMRRNRNKTGAVGYR